MCRAAKVICVGLCLVLLATGALSVLAAPPAAETQAAAPKAAEPQPATEPKDAEKSKAAEPKPAPEPKLAEGARRVIEKFFDTMVAENFDDQIGLWDPAGPQLADRKEFLVTLFAETEQITRGPLRVLLVQPAEQPGQLRVWVRLPMGGVQASDGKPSPFFTDPTDRFFLLNEQDDHWLVYAYGFLTEDMARRALTAPNRAVRHEMFDALPSEGADKEGEIMAALIQCYMQADPALRKRLLIEEELFTQSDAPIDILARGAVRVDTTDDPTRSLMLLERAEEIARHADYVYGLAYIASQRGMVQFKHGQLEAAETSLRRARDLFSTRQGHASHLMAVNILLARIYLLQERGADALVALEDAEQMRLRSPVKKTEGRGLIGDAWVEMLEQRDQLETEALRAMAAGEFEKALKIFGEGLALEQAVYGKDGLDQIGSLRTLCEIQAELGATDEALELAAQLTEVGQHLTGADGSLAHFGGVLADYAKRLAKFSPEQLASLRRARQLEVQSYVTQEDPKVYRERLPEFEQGSRESREIRRKLLGESHYETAMSTYRLAYILEDRSEELEAAPLALAAAKQLQADCGPQWVSTKFCIRLALRMVDAARRKLVDEGKFAAARDQAVAVNALAEALYGKAHPRTLLAVARRDELVRCAKMPAAQQAALVEARRRFYKAVEKSDEGKFQAGAAEAATQIAAFTKLLGPQSVYLADALYDYSRLLLGAGQFQPALAELERAAKINDRIGSPNVEVLRLLIGFHASSGNLREADRLYHQALALAKANQEVDEDAYFLLLYDYTAFRKSCGQLSLAVGDFADLVCIANRRLFPRENPIFASAQLRLELPDSAFSKPDDCVKYAKLLLDGPDMLTASAETRLNCYQAAARILERVGTEEALRARRLNLNALAMAYLIGKQPREAQAASEEYLNGSNPDSPIELTGIQRARVMLGRAFYMQGEFAKAETVLRQALADAPKALFGSRIETGALETLGILEFSLGHYDEALAVILRRYELNDNVNASTFDITSEAAMRSVIEDDDWGGSLMWFALAAPPEKRQPFVSAAFERLKKSRARVFEAICEVRERQRLAQSNPRIAALALELQQRRQTLNDLALSPPADLIHAEWQGRLTLLRRECDELESRLKIALGEVGAAKPGASRQVSAVDPMQKLPPNAVWVEFLQLSPAEFYPDKPINIDFPMHLIAFVVRGSAPQDVQLLDLGESADVAELIGEFRRGVEQALRAYAATDPEQLAKKERGWEAGLEEPSTALYRRLLAPVLALAQPGDQLWVVPEGELFRLPLESLRDDEGHYLVESHDVVYFNSSRDLLRQSDEPGQGVVILAGADFDLSDEDVAAARERLVPQVAARPEPEAAQPKPDDLALRGGVAAELRGLKWKKLDATVAEADDVARALSGGRFGKVQEYLGADALEEVLKNLPQPPQILHIATHGFFLPPPAGANADAAAMSEASVNPEYAQARGFARLRQMESPLLRSGIVLSSANSLGTQRSGDDGWLTAQEIALLNLRGTQLVVLSACESGLGDVSVGEGVEGLRFAFQYAGARALVSSLFKVPDEETRRLMAAFYAGLRAGKGNSQALRDAKLAVIKERRAQGGAAHPMFWASFVLVGDCDQPPAAAKK